MDESSCTNLYAIYRRPGHVKRPCYIGHKWQTKTIHQPSETEERLLRVDPMWWARSWTGRSGRSAGSGGDGPNTCSWSSNCCANCSSNLCNHLSKQQKLKTVDQNCWIYRPVYKMCKSLLFTFRTTELTKFITQSLLWADNAQPIKKF